MSGMTRNIAGRIGTAGATSWRNRMHNAGAQIAQRAAPALTTAAQYGAVDRVAGWASGGAITAGTLAQDTAAPVGRTGKAVRFQGCTLTGAGQLSWRYRMEAADAVALKNQTGTFQIKVQHNVGSAINYTVIVRKPTVADNFGSVTAIGTAPAQSVASGSASQLVYTLALADCSSGLEIEVQAACGAVTTKDFWFTEWGMEEGSSATPISFRPVGDELALCQRYYETGLEPFFYISSLASATSGYGEVKFQVAKRVSPTITMTSWQYYSSGASTAFTPALSSATADRFAFTGSGLSNWQGWSANGSWTASAEL